MQPPGDDPVPTVPSGLVPVEGAPARKTPGRLWLGLAGAAVVGCALGAVLWGSQQSQRHSAELAQLGAQTERDRAKGVKQLQTQSQLRIEGQGAIAMQEAGMVAPAAAALARVAAAMPALDRGVYAQAAHFLVPRLLSFEEATQGILPGETVRWQGSNLVRGLDGQLRELPGQAIAAHLFSPSGSELLVVDTDRQVWLHQWPALTTAGPHPLGPVCIDGLDFLPDGRFAVDTAALRDEGQPGSATPGPWAPAAGTAVRIVLGRDGKPGPPAARETSAVSRCAPSPARRGSEATARPAAQRRLQFPRLRDETTFWRVAPRPEPARETPAVLPLDIRDRPPYGELDGSGLPGTPEEREAVIRSLGDEALTTGMIRGEGRSIALSLHLAAANQATALRVCEFDPSSRKIAACGSIPLPANVSPVYAPDHRRALLTTNDGQGEPFRLVDIARLGRRCSVPQAPAERVDTAAFNAAGDRLAVVTVDHELWSFELTAACEARLVVRQALPALREGARSTIAWLDAHTVVWVAGQGEVFAMDARDGMMRWSRHTLWPLAARGVQVRASGDGRLVVFHDQRHLQLASAANGLALAGLLDVRTLKAPDQKPGGEICEAEPGRNGEVHLRVQAGGCASNAPTATTTWRRLAPDDPQLASQGKPGLWRRTAISERDGRTAVTLQELLR